MTAIKKLQERWERSPWKEVAARINAALNEKPPSAFASELIGLPLTDEVPGYLDLRGAPLTEGVFRQAWDDIDLSSGRTEIWRKLPGGSEQLDGPLAMTGSRLRRCRFVKTKVHLSGGNELRDCDLSGANLSQSLLRDSVFERCDLRKANLRGVLAANSRFIDCRFDGAQLARADFTDVDFSGSDFRGIRVDGVTHFANVRVSEGTQFDPSTLALADSDDDLLQRFGGS